MSRRNARALDKLCRELRGQRPGITLYTFREGTGSDSDHKPWLRDANGVGVVRAVDIMTSDHTKLAPNLAAKLGHHPALGPGAYIISKQRIMSTDRLAEGWRPMENRGDPTANHMDHVHVSLTKSQAGYDSPAPWGALFVGSSTGAGSTLPLGLGSLSPVAVDLNGNPVSGTNVGLGLPGVELDDIGPAIQKLVITAGALALGAVLIVLGAARATKPARQAVSDAGAQVTEKATQAASLAAPELRAATAATTATKGAR